MGVNYISEIGDFKKPIEVRKKEWEIKRASKLKDRIKKGRCPKCGSGRLEPRNGKLGRFFGCNNYPNCKYIYVEE
jgi:ssDNA-binding Zn-finger/Zn-ribbon topoisomerase 1